MFWQLSCIFLPEGLLWPVALSNWNPVRRKQRYVLMIHFGLQVVCQLWFLLVFHWESRKGIGICRFMSNLLELFNVFSFIIILKVFTVTKGDVMPTSFVFYGAVALLAMSEALWLQCYKGRLDILFYIYSMEIVLDFTFPICFESCIINRLINVFSRSQSIAIRSIKGHRAFMMFLGFENGFCEFTKADAYQGPPILMFFHYSESLVYLDYLRHKVLIVTIITLFNQLVLQYLNQFAYKLEICILLSQWFKPKVYGTWWLGWSWLAMSVWLQRHGGYKI